MKRFVAVDINGRLSQEMDSCIAVVEWMNVHNPSSGDCVVWEKTYSGDVCLIKNQVSVNIATVRINSKWMN